ncbi:Basic-leucine zipper (bZIP) transcription factor family protein [Raphanus sativus]|uniref:Basic leucine zipper 19 n=1 Tax=Raphanus sativus TaxID=3726 RepID=A0A6J0K5Z0_RAPSA|nr:basic leucine zipper 19 [Raphanus sativus]KAJ4883268.1 Basic-leucine zipper (bZIP) transcription factor family protein [Raphanus sativus]
MSDPSFPVPTSFQVSNGGSQEEEKKVGYVNYEVEPGFTIRLRQNIDPAMDPKKLRRIVSNRVAAQKSRWKKLQYIDNLVTKSRDLQWQVNMLRSQVEMASEQKQCLEREQMELKECMSGWLHYFISSQGEIEANTAEIERLKKKMARMI